MQRLPTSLSVFDRILAAIASVKLLHAIGLVVMLGTAIVMCGVFLEVRGEANLNEAGGYAAIVKYRDSLAREPLEPMQYLATGLRLKLKSFGGNQQAIGLLVTYLGTGLVIAFILSARYAWAVRVRASTPRK